MQDSSFFSQSRKLLSNANVQRLSTRFTMISLKQLHQYHVFDSLQWMLGRQMNFALLDSSLSTYNALSVGVLSMRLMINVIDIVQYTVFEDENKPELNASDRFYAKVNEHHYQLANDAVWSVVNALCNYSAYFRLSPVVPNYLMVGFTVFDVALLCYELYLENQAYKAGCFSECEHIKNQSSLLFCIAAASLMLGAFTAGFLLFPPTLLPFCFLACNIAMAMFLSSNEFGLWKEAHFKKFGVDEAWNNLSFAMAKNLIAPFVILGAFTVNAPAAILLTLGYMAYEQGYLAMLPALFCNESKGNDAELEQDHASPCCSVRASV